MCARTAGDPRSIPVTPRRCRGVTGTAFPQLKCPVPTCVPGDSQAQGAGMVSTVEGSRARPTQRSSTSAARRGRPGEGRTALPEIYNVSAIETRAARRKRNTVSPSMNTSGNPRVLTLPSLFPSPRDSSFLLINSRATKSLFVSKEKRRQRHGREFDHDFLCL